MARKSWQPELEVAGHIATTVRKQLETMLLFASFVLFFIPFGIPVCELVPAS